MQEAHGHTDNSATLESDQDPLCWICLSNDSDGGELLSNICGCRGSQRFVHNRCLLRWRLNCLAEGRGVAFYRCTICQEEFKVQPNWFLIFAINFTKLLTIICTPRGVFKALAILLGSIILQYSSVSFASIIFQYSLGYDVRVWKAGLTYLEDVLNCSSAVKFVNDVTRPRHGLPNDVWYGIIEPHGGSSCEAVTGAQLVYWGKSDGSVDLILHGGWDDCRGARDRLLVAAREDLIVNGTNAWVELSVVAPDGGSCPGSIYGHTATTIPELSIKDTIVLLVLGGQTAGGYRRYSDRYGLLEITDVDGRKSARWRMCGASPVAQRAWHTATLLPGSPSRVFICGGRESLQNIAAGIFGFGVDSDETFRVAEGKPCMRQGHSAVLHGEWIFVMGGTSHLGGGIPWMGTDLDDILSYHVSEDRWSPAYHVDFAGVSPIRRQHVAISMTTPKDLDVHVLLYGGGFGGKVGTSLLSIRANSSGVESVNLTSLQHMVPTNCAPRLPFSVEPPSLRGHSGVWTGHEILMFGGAERESRGYFGILVAMPRLLEHSSGVEHPDDTANTSKTV